MKIIVASPRGDLSPDLVRQIAADNGFDAVRAGVVDGREWQIAVEFDERNEAVTADSIVEIARRAGAEVSSADVSVTPRWATSLLGFAAV